MEWRTPATDGVDGAGRVVDRLLPSAGAMAVACVLGGEDRRTMCMATADLSLSDLDVLTGDVGMHQVGPVAWARRYVQGFVESEEVPVPGAGVP